MDQSLGQDGSLLAVRRFAFETKGQAHNFGIPLLEMVSARLEDYGSAVTTMDEVRIEHLRVYLDTIIDVAEGNIAPDEPAANVVRTLPARPASPRMEDTDIRDVEVILVMLHGAQTRFVERELQACGYRVSICTSTIAALDHAIHTKPDMMIISAIMPGMNGIDLAIALSHMPDTRNIPLALITSLDASDERLQFVPEGVPLISKSVRFGDDLAEALSYHFLL
ncbi:MAG: hypothetical protein H6842_12405 [Rhodospirillaceae bacterium]|nr:hypothetical protein [Rhodospirillaceae bacterium]